MKVTSLGKVLPQWVKPFDDDNFEYCYKPLPGYIFRSVLQYVVRNEDGEAVFGGDSVETMLRKGLVGWRNFPDASGNDLPFSYENVDRLPAELVDVITNRIFASSYLTEDEKKK